MSFKPSQLALASTLALVTLSPCLQAETPARMSPEERSAIEAAAAPVADQVKAKAAGLKDQIEADRRQSNETNSAIRDFLAQAALTTVSIEDVPAAPATGKVASSEPSVPPTKPLEVKPGPNDTIISADDGMYFDAEAGLLVYLKNVRLTGPDFDLSGANELKVFLGKKEAKKKEPAQKIEPAPEPAKDEKRSATPGILGATGGFGEPEKIIATGAVKVTQKAKDGKPPVVASAAVLTYDAKSGEIILNGGYPWVQQGTTFMRAKEANLYLRIRKDGSFATGGGLWDMGGQLDAAPGAKPANPAPEKPANR